MLYAAMVGCFKCLTWSFLKFKKYCVLSSIGHNSYSKQTQGYENIYDL